MMRTLVDSSAFRIATIYIAGAAAWIIGSDALVYFQIEPPNHWLAATIKGLTFILISGVLIYFLVRQPLKKLKEALEHQIALKNQFERAQSVGSIGSWEVDFATGTLTWSDETYRIFEIDKNGFKATEEAFLELVHPDDRKALWKAREEWLRLGGLFTFEHRILTPTGKAKVVIEHAEVFYHLDGRLNYTTGTVQDVTEQRAKETEALAWHNRLEVAVQAAQIGIWEYTPSNDKLIWNAKMFELFGVAKGEFRGEFSDWRKAVHPDDLKAAEVPVLEVLAGDSPSFSIEFRIIRPSDGKVRHLLGYGKLTRSILLDGQDVLTGANMDITDWISTREQLTHSQKLETIGQLTGGIAHDFNNQLTVIISCLEAIRDSAAEDVEIIAFSSEGQKAAQNAADLTSRLLSFSRKQALMPKTTNLNDLLTDIEPLVRRTLPETVSLTTSRANQLWPCDIDRGQIESAIINLAVNARDAMPDGGRIIIETANADLDDDDCKDIDELEPGSYVTLAVSDTGTGMTREVQEKAFDPFFTTKEIGKGTGLGLSMIYGFMKQSNGHVSLVSEFGNGTTVKLYFPKSQRECVPISTEHRHEAPITGGDESILLVEDDPMVSKQLEMQLERLGYSVISASNGEEALSIIDESDAFDLLLTDVVLPGGMMGPQLAKEVVARAPNMKVLFTSGYTEDAIILNDRLDTGVHLLQKPFRRKDLARKLRELLGEPNPSS